LFAALKISERADFHRVQKKILPRFKKEKMPGWSWTIGGYHGNALTFLVPGMRTPDVQEALFMFVLLA